MTDVVTRVGRRLSTGYGDVLERTFGRYYDPVVKVLLPLVVIPIVGGIADQEPGFAAFGVVSGLFYAWMLYRSEQRWSQ